MPIAASDLLIAPGLAVLTQTMTDCKQHLFFHGLSYEHRIFSSKADRAE